MPLISYCFVIIRVSKQVEDDSVFAAGSSAQTKKPEVVDKAAKMAETEVASALATANSSRNLTSFEGELPKAAGAPGSLKPGEQNVVIALDGSEQSVQAVNCKCWGLIRGVKDQRCCYVVCVMYLKDKEA